MGFLWYEELGNTTALVNVGPFQNMLPHAYWGSTEYVAEPMGSAWSFWNYRGDTGMTAKRWPLAAVAVRPGDVAAVPEPQTLALALLGLGLAAGVRRRAS